MMNGIEFTKTPVFQRSKLSKDMQLGAVANIYMAKN